MAQQAVWQGMSQRMEKGILDSGGSYRWAVPAQPRSPNQLSQNSCRLKRMKLAHWGAGGFRQSRRQGSLRITVPAAHLGNAGAMSPDSWQDVRNARLRQFYGQRTSTPTPVAAPSRPPKRRRRKTPSPPTWYDAHRMKKVTFLFDGKGRRYRHFTVLDDTRLEPHDDDIAWLEFLHGFGDQSSPRCGYSLRQHGPTQACAESHGAACSCKFGEHNGPVFYLPEQRRSGAATKRDIDRP